MKKNKKRSFTHPLLPPPSPLSPPQVPPSISEPIPRFHTPEFFQNYIKLIYPPLSPSTHPITFICIHSVTRYGFDQKTDYICNSIESDATNSSIRLRRYYIDASRLKAKKRGREGRTEREKERESIMEKEKKVSAYTLR